MAEEDKRLEAGRDLKQEVYYNLDNPLSDTAADEEAKSIFKYKVILAVLLHLSVEEFAECSLQEVEELIDEVQEGVEVSSGAAGRETITQENSESTLIKEKTVTFDLLFEVAMPKTDERKICRLVVDLEIQKSMDLAYPVEYRGVYYLARKVSDQLNYVYEDSTEYKRLKKVVTIWIGLSGMREDLKNSIIRYRMAPVEAKGVSDGIRLPPADLMEMVMIRLGDEASDQDEPVVKFLYSIFGYRQYKKYFDAYISADVQEKNPELKEEVEKMTGIALFNYNIGKSDGVKEGIEQGIEQKAGDIVERMLQKGKSIAEIEEMTGCKPDFIRRVEERMLVSQ